MTASACLRVFPIMYCLKFSFSCGGKDFLFQNDKGRYLLKKPSFDIKVKSSVLVNSPEGVDIACRNGWGFFLTGLARTNIFYWSWAATCELLQYSCHMWPQGKRGTYFKIFIWRNIHCEQKQKLPSKGKTLHLTSSVVRLAWEWLHININIPRLCTWNTFFLKTKTL